LIVLRLLDVVSPVQLNHQHVFLTIEVHDVTADGMLPAEPGAVHLAGTKAHPKQTLNICLVASEALCIGTKL
jgi:hypothetical protein